MTGVDVLGYTAAFCTTAAFLPQAIKVLRHGDTQALSLWMYVLFVAGVSLWLWYGILKADAAIIAANALTVVLALAILSVKIRNDVLLKRKGRS